MKSSISSILMSSLKFNRTQSSLSENISIPIPRAFVENNKQQLFNTAAAGDQKLKKEKLGKEMSIEDLEKLQHIPENLECHIL